MGSQQPHSGGPKGKAEPVSYTHLDVYKRQVFDFLESEGYIRLKADACTSSHELYEVYRMWCEENSRNAIKARGFSDALIAKCV